MTLYANLEAAQTVRGPEPGGPDGLKVDTAGNVYCATGNVSRSGSAGIYIIDPKGKKLGRIVHGYPRRVKPATAPIVQS